MIPGGPRLFSRTRLAGALVLAVGVAAVFAISATLPSAQSAPPAPAPPAPLTPADQAMQALNSGRYEDVDGILKTASDPRAVALRAQALIALGKYADAEKLLTPAVSSAPTSDAALELGLLQQYVGRRQDARRTLQRVADGLQARSAGEFLRRGRALRALGEFKAANEDFRSANRLAPGDVATNVAWGDLFLEKFDRPNALKSYQDALKTDPTNVAARVGLARVAAEGNPPAAKEALESALKTNPRSVQALLLSAELALDDRKRDDAADAIAKALAVNPNSLEAGALQAGAAFIANKPDEVEARAQAVLKINPTYGEVYRIVADHAARGYLFDEAAAFVRKALIIDPNNAQAYADLGMYLLRTGDEGEARTSLERAFKDDPYNVSTFNSLDLLDKIAKFETITDGDLTFRFDKEEVAVMREYAIPLAKEALAALSKRYQFTPKGPLLIEMFPKHDDFAVRTIGLPGMIGALGACFGRVVTLDSPRARLKPGEFNWGETLWHELAHVITLQMSGNRVPRWLTEGISVYEERRARPEWGKESDISFLQALSEGKTLKLDVLNEGFSDPQTISLAYYEASLVVDHLVQTYGEPALWKMLRAYGRGLETEDALKDAYGISIAQLQTSFDGYLDKQYGAALRAWKAPEIKEKPSLDDLKTLAAANPESFRVQMMLADMLNTSGDKAGAIATFERAAALLPTANGRGNPHVYIGRIAEEMGNADRAIAAYEAVLKIDNADVDSARRLAALLEKKGDAARTEDAYRRWVAADPFDTRAQTALGRLALKRKDAVAAQHAFRAALATKPPDEAAAHTDLAEAYLAAGQAAEAKKHTLEALEIAPSFERAQELLLKLGER